MPHVTLLLSKGFGRFFAVLDKGPQDEAAVSPGVFDEGDLRTSAAEMCRCVLEHLDNNNFVVGFYAAWTLTAI